MKLEINLWGRYHLLYVTDFYVQTLATSSSWLLPTTAPDSYRQCRVRDLGWLRWR